MEYGCLTLYYVLIFITETSRGAVIPTALHQIGLRQDELQLTKSTRNTGILLSTVRNKRDAPHLAVLIPVPPETKHTCDDHEESTVTKQLHVLSTDGSSFEYSEDEKPIPKSTDSIHDTYSYSNDNDISIEHTQNDCKQQTVQTLIDQVQNNNRLNLFQQLMNAEVLDNILILRNPFRKGCKKRCVKDKVDRDQELRKDNKFETIIKKVNCKSIGKRPVPCKSKSRHRYQYSTTTESGTTNSELEVNMSKSTEQNTGESTNSYRDNSDKNLGIRMKGQNKGKINYDQNSVIKNVKETDKKVTSFSEGKITETSNINGIIRNLHKPEKLTQENTGDYNEENVMKNTELHNVNQYVAENTVMSHKEEVTPSSKNSYESSEDLQLSEKSIGNSEQESKIPSVLTQSLPPKAENTEKYYIDFLNNLAAEPALDMDKIEEMVNPKYDKTHTHQNENYLNLPQDIREHSTNQEVDSRKKDYGNEPKKITDSGKQDKLASFFDNKYAPLSPSINIRGTDSGNAPIKSYKPDSQNLDTLTSIPNNKYTTSHDASQSPGTGSRAGDSGNETTKAYKLESGKPNILDSVYENENATSLKASQAFARNSTEEVFGNITTKAYTHDSEQTDLLVNSSDNEYATSQKVSQPPDTYSENYKSETTEVTNTESEKPDMLSSIHYDGKSQDTLQSSGTNTRGKDSGNEPINSYTPESQNSDTLASIHNNEYTTSYDASQSLGPGSRAEDSRNETTKAYTLESEKPNILDSIYENENAISNRASHDFGRDSTTEDTRTVTTKAYTYDLQNPDILNSTHNNEYATSQEASLPSATFSRDKNKTTKAYAPSSGKPETLPGIHSNGKSQEASQILGIDNSKENILRKPTSVYPSDILANTPRNESTTVQKASLSQNADRKIKNNINETYVPNIEKSDLQAITPDTTNNRSHEVSQYPGLHRTEEDNNYGNETKKAYTLNLETPHTLMSTHGKEYTTSPEVQPSGIDRNDENSLRESTNIYTLDSEKLDVLANTHNTENDTTHKSSQPPGIDRTQKDYDYGSETTTPYILDSEKTDKLISTHDSKYTKGEGISQPLGRDNSNENSLGVPSSIYTPDSEKLNILASTHDTENDTSHESSQDYSHGIDRTEKNYDYGSVTTDTYTFNSEKPGTAVSIRDNEYTKGQGVSQPQESSSTYSPDTPKLHILSHDIENDTSRNQELSQSPGIVRTVKDYGYGNETILPLTFDTTKPNTLVSTQDNEYAEGQETSQLPGINSSKENSVREPSRIHSSDSAKPGILAIIHDTESNRNHESSQPPGIDRTEEDYNYGTQITKAYTPELEKPGTFVSTLDNEYVKSQAASQPLGKDSSTESSVREPSSISTSDSAKQDILANNTHDTENDRNHESAQSLGIDRAEEDNDYRTQTTKPYTHDLERLGTSVSTQDNEYAKGQGVSQLPDTDINKENPLTEPSSIYAPDTAKLDIQANTHDTENEKSQKLFQSPGIDRTEEDYGYGRETTKSSTFDTDKLGTLVSTQDNKYAKGQGVLQPPGVTFHSSMENSLQEPSSTYTADSEKSDVMANTHVTENNKSHESSQLHGIDSTEDYDYGSETAKKYTFDAEKPDTLVTTPDNEYAKGQGVSQLPGIDINKGNPLMEPSSIYTPDTAKPDIQANTHDKSQELFQSPGTDRTEEDYGFRSETAKSSTLDTDKLGTLGSTQDNEYARGQGVLHPSGIDSRMENSVWEPSNNYTADSEKSKVLANTNNSKNDRSHNSAQSQGVDRTEVYDYESETTKPSIFDTEEPGTIVSTHDNEYAKGQGSSQLPGVNTSMKNSLQAASSTYTADSENPDVLANTHVTENNKSHESSQHSVIGKTEEDYDYGTQTTKTYTLEPEVPSLLVNTHDNNYATSQEASRSFGADNKVDGFTSEPVNADIQDSEKADRLASILDYEYDTNQEKDSIKEDYGNEPTKSYTSDLQKSDTLNTKHSNENNRNHNSQSSDRDSIEGDFGSDTADSNKPDTLANVSDNEYTINQQFSKFPGTDNEEEDYGNTSARPLTADSETPDALAMIHDSSQNTEKNNGTESSNGHISGSEKTKTVSTNHNNDYTRDNNIALSNSSLTKQAIQYTGELSNITDFDEDTSKLMNTNEINKTHSEYVTSQGSLLSATLKPLQADELRNEHVDVLLKNDTIGGNALWEMPNDPMKTFNNETNTEYSSNEENVLTENSLDAMYNYSTTPAAVLTANGTNQEIPSWKKLGILSRTHFNQTDNGFLPSFLPSQDTEAQVKSDEFTERLSVNDASTEISPKEPDTLGSTHTNELDSEVTLLPDGSYSMGTSDNKSENTAKLSTNNKNMESNMKDMLAGTHTPSETQSNKETVVTQREESQYNPNNKINQDNTTKLELVASPKDNNITKEVILESKSGKQDANPNNGTQPASPGKEKLMLPYTMQNNTDDNSTPLTSVLSWFKNSELYDKGLEYFFGHHTNQKENSTKLPEQKEIQSSNSIKTKDVTEIPDNSFTGKNDVTAKTDKNKYGHFVGSICIPKKQQNISLIELLTGHFLLEKNNNNIILKKKQQTTNCSSDFENCQVFIKPEENENNLQDKEVLNNLTVKIIKNALVQSLVHGDNENKNSSSILPNNFSASTQQNETSAETMMEMETIGNAQENHSMIAQNESKTKNSKKQIIISMEKTDNNSHKRKRKDTVNSDSETKKECLDTILSALYHYYTANNNTLGSAYLPSTHSTKQESLSQNQYSSTDNSHDFNDKNSHYENTETDSLRTEHSREEQWNHSDESNNLNGQNTKYRNEKSALSSKHIEHHTKRNCTSKNNMLQEQSSVPTHDDTNKDEIILPNESLKIDRKLFEKFLTIYNMHNKTCKEHKQDILEQINCKENTDGSITLGTRRRFPLGSTETETLSEEQRNGLTGTEPPLTKYEKNIGSRMDTIINILKSIRDIMVQN